MNNSNIPEQSPTGLELFQDTESFLNELTDATEIDLLEVASATAIVSAHDNKYNLNLKVYA